LRAVLKSHKAIPVSQFGYGGDGKTAFQATFLYRVLQQPMLNADVNNCFHLKQLDNSPRRSFV
jgi:hypothetical protein